MSRVFVEQSMTRLADLVRTQVRSAVDRLGAAFGAENLTAVIASVLSLHHAELDTTLRALGEIVLVLAANLYEARSLFAARTTRAPRLIQLDLQRLNEPHEVLLHAQAILGLLFKRLHLIGQLLVLLPESLDLELVLLDLSLERLDQLLAFLLDHDQLLLELLSIGFGLHAHLLLAFKLTLQAQPDGHLVLRVRVPLDFVSHSLQLFNLVQRLQVLLVQRLVGDHEPYELLSERAHLTVQLLLGQVAARVVLLIELFHENGLLAVELLVLGFHAQILLLERVVLQLDLFHVAAQVVVEFDELF